MVLAEKTYVILILLKSTLFSSGFSTNRTTHATDTSVVTSSQTQQNAYSTASGLHGYHGHDSYLKGFGISKIPVYESTIHDLVTRYKESSYSRIYPKFDSIFDLIKFDLDLLEERPCSVYPYTEENKTINYVYIFIHYKVHFLSIFDEISRTCKINEFTKFKYAMFINGDLKPTFDEAISAEIDNLLKNDKFVMFLKLLIPEIFYIVEINPNLDYIKERLKKDPFGIDFIVFNKKLYRQGLTILYGSTNYKQFLENFVILKASSITFCFHRYIEMPRLSENLSKYFLLLLIPFNIIQSYAPGADNDYSTLTTDKIYENIVRQAFTNSKLRMKIHKVMNSCLSFVYKEDHSKLGSEKRELLRLMDDRSYNEFLKKFYKLWKETFYRQRQIMLGIH